MYSVYYYHPAPACQAEQLSTQNAPQAKVYVMGGAAHRALSELPQAALARASIVPGRRMIVLQNKGIAEGKFNVVDNRLQFQGVFREKNGAVITGLHVSGSLFGSGSVALPSGAKLEGEFTREGSNVVCQGKRTLANGDVAFGKFIHWRLEGAVDSQLKDYYEEELGVHLLTSFEKLASRRERSSKTTQ